MGNPIGIGMSQELDSNMALIALLQCFGAYIQNADARITIKSKGTRDALNFMRDLYQARHDERGVRLDGFVEQRRVPRGPAVAGDERDLDRPERRAAERARSTRTSGSCPSPTAPGRAWASST